MNASSIDCLAELASRFSTAVASARTTSSTSWVVMIDGRRRCRALARPDARRRRLAPNSARDLSAKDATSLNRRNLRTDQSSLPFLQEGSRRGAMMRWSFSRYRMIRLATGQTELKKSLARQPAPAILRRSLPSPFVTLINNLGSISGTLRHDAEHFSRCFSC
jgi:hypothetical protein